MAVSAEVVITEGNFTLRLFDQEVPNTVTNFVGLAKGTEIMFAPAAAKSSM